MANEPDGDRLKQKDAVWPFVGLYCFMLLGIFVSLGNTDPISMDFTPSVILGLSIVVGAIAYFAAARLKGHALFGFGSRTLLRNLGWHIFVLTGIIFLSHLFFRALISILVVSFSGAYIRRIMQTSERTRRLPLRLGRHGQRRL